MSNRLFYAAAWLLAAWLAPAGAADYPTKPVRLIVPFPPGGGNDLLGRPVAQKLTVLRISSPPIFHGMIKRDVEKWRRVVKEANLSFTS